MFVSAPGSSRPSVVSASVCGTRAISIPSPSSAATVSETPSTAIDPFSAQYVNNVTIDYVTSMQGSGFTFKNPNSTGGCGCGSSFSA